MMEVLLSAPLLTIQDSGRSGWRHLGVPQCGMMDDLALQQGNLLLGNDDSAAGLEITSGPVLLKFHGDCRIVVMGADLNSSITGADQLAKVSRLIPGFVYHIAAGDCVRLGAPSVPGLRAMLMVSGGFAVEPVLGSRSTDLINGFGGLHGQALRAGDQVPIGTQTSIRRRQGVRQCSWQPVFRVIRGPDISRTAEDMLHQFVNALWQVDARSNRMGLRLQGDALQRFAATQTYSRSFSIGVLPGVIQLPPDAQPIVLAADAQTTGGYPAIASIINTDLWQLAYMTPGTRVQFYEITLAEAHGLASHRKRQLDKLRAALAMSGNA